MDFATAFRDYETDGVPSSGEHEVDKADVRAAGMRVESLALNAAALDDNPQAGTTYTIQQSDLGLIVPISNASSITVTLPNDKAEGFICAVEQSGAGQITFVPASGATLKNAFDQTKTWGQDASVGLRVRSNSDGASAVWVLTGQTGD